MAKTNAAVFPVPDWLCAIIFWGGSAKSVGNAVSYPEINLKINQFPFVVNGVEKTHLDFRWRIESHFVNTFQQFRFSGPKKNVQVNIPLDTPCTEKTYNFNASNVLTEYNGDDGSFRCTSTSDFDSTRPFRMIFWNKLASAALQTFNGIFGNYIFLRLLSFSHRIEYLTTSADSSDVCSGLLPFFMLKFVTLPFKRQSKVFFRLAFRKPLQSQ